MHVFLVLLKRMPCSRSPVCQPYLSGRSITAALPLRTDGYSFKVQVELRYKAAWTTEDFPNVLLSSTGAFVLQGMGAASHVDDGRAGKLHFYFQTVDGVGANGRGGSHVISDATLPVNQWHTVILEKTADTMCMQVDSQDPACVFRSVSESQFRMKHPGVVTDAVSNIEARNFVDLSGLEALEPATRHHASPQPTLPREAAAEDFPLRRPRKVGILARKSDCMLSRTHCLSYRRGFCGGRAKLDGLPSGIRSSCQRGSMSSGRCNFGTGVWLVIKYGKPASRVPRGK